MDIEPIFPFSISARYHSICPEGEAQRCQGFRTHRTNGKIRVYYCHDRMCPELFPQMLKCPCNEHYECKGNYWNNEEHICKRKEALENRMIKD